MNTIATSVLKTFTEKFAVTPKLYFSPGRINLIGEHVDYNDGFVMPAAINKGIYYAIAENNSEEINFYAVDFNEALNINTTDIKRMDGWKNYVLSVVNEFLMLGVKVPGFNCVFAGDIPRGSGMSSSAAVEGGMAYALNEILGTNLDRMKLALLCQRAEHNFPQVNCGIMDQFANMMGKKDNVLLLDCRSMEYQYFPLHLNGYKIVLLNSNVEHALVSGEYNLRRQRCEQGLKILQAQLKINSFRNIEDVAALQTCQSLMEQKVYDCCLYVVEEIARAKKAAQFLQQDNLIEFGKLMFATHQGLSKLYEVSCKELDFLVKLAAENNDIIGSRLMGGGFGGCTINIVKEAGVKTFIDTATEAYQQKFNIKLEAYITETGDGTYQIS